MQFDLVSPERKLFSAEVTEVQVPASEGDMTVMDDHASVLSTLRPGILEIHGDNPQEFMVSGGFIEITDGSVSVLAEQALPVDEVNQEIMTNLMHEANIALESSDGDAKTLAAKYVNDLTQLAGRLNLTV